MGFGLVVGLSVLVYEARVRLGLRLIPGRVGLDSGLQ